MEKTNKTSFGWYAAVGVAAVVAALSLELIEITETLDTVTSVLRATTETLERMAAARQYEIPSDVECGDGYRLRWVTLSSQVDDQHSVIRHDAGDSEFGRSVCDAIVELVERERERSDALDRCIAEVDAKLNEATR